MLHTDLIRNPLSALIVENPQTLGGYTMKYLTQYLILGILIRVFSQEPWAMHDVTMFDEAMTIELRPLMNGFVTEFCKTKILPRYSKYALMKILVGHGADPTITTDADLNASQAMHFAAEAGDASLL